MEYIVGFVVPDDNTPTELGNINIMGYSIIVMSERDAIIMLKFPTKRQRYAEHK